MPDTALPPALPPRPEDLVRAYVPLTEQYIEGDHPTANPDGVTNSNVDYSPKTQEEKAELLHVEMVEPVETAPEEPYPEGGGPTEEDRRALLRQAHPPLELVAAEDVDAQTIANLAAGGAVVGAIPERTIA